jgi:hypothetical protein
MAAICVGSGPNSMCVVLGRVDSGPVLEIVYDSRLIFQYGHYLCWVRS